MTHNHKRLITYTPWKDTPIYDIKITPSGERIGYLLDNKWHYIGLNSTFEVVPIDIVRRSSRPSFYRVKDGNRVFLLEKGVQLRKTGSCLQFRKKRI